LRTLNVKCHGHSAAHSTDIRL